MTSINASPQITTPGNEPSDLLEALLAAQSDRSLPPVAQWHPERVGDSRMRIDRDGRWFHDEREIKRAGMYRVFSTVLRREGSEHFLVTPVEKLRIEVADSPFVVTALTCDHEQTDAQRIVLTTNVDDHVLVGADHPLVVRQTGDQSIPYVEVRAGLMARLLRSVFYQLVETGKVVGPELTVLSNGTRFSLGRV